MHSDDQIIIRPATMHDAEGIARVHVEAWRETYRGIVPQAHLDSLTPEARKARWEQILPDVTRRPKFHLVAEQAGRIIGFAGGGPARGGDGTFAGETYAIYIDPQHQRRGLGRCLMHACADALRREKFDSMFVWVLAENHACGFYGRLGGRRFAEQKIEIGGKKLIEVAYGWSDLGISFPPVPDVAASSASSPPSPESPR